MPIPMLARNAIVQAIDRSCAEDSVQLTDGQLSKLMDTIARYLDSAGYVVVLASEVGFPAPERPNP